MMGDRGVTFTPRRAGLLLAGVLDANRRSQSSLHGLCRRGVAAEWVSRGDFSSRPLAEQGFLLLYSFADKLTRQVRRGRSVGYRGALRETSAEQPSARREQVRITWALWDVVVEKQNGRGALRTLRPRGHRGRVGPSGLNVQVNSVEPRSVDFIDRVVERFWMHWCEAGM